MGHKKISISNKTYYEYDSPEEALLESIVNVNISLNVSDDTFHKVLEVVQIVNVRDVVIKNYYHWRDNIFYIVNNMIMSIGKLSPMKTVQDIKWKDYSVEIREDVFKKIANSLGIIDESENDVDEFQDNLDEDV